MTRGAAAAGALSRVEVSPPPCLLSLLARYRWLFELDGTDKNTRWPLVFLWGVEPRDSGSALDPDDKGRATYAADAAFDATAPASQDFLLRFCAAARKQPFFERSSTRLDYVAICAPELAAAAAAVPCNETTDDASDEGDGLRWRAPVATRLRDGWPLAFPRRDRCCGHVDDGSAAGGGWRGEAGGGAPLGGPLAACLLYTSPSPRDGLLSRMPSSA